MSGAWVLSLAWALNQWVHPLVARVGFVAEPVTNGMPDLSNVGPPAADSPEKFGPITPTNEGSSATFLAIGGITVGDPVVSSPTNSIFTGSFPNLPELAWSNASEAALKPGVTSPAAAPVNAPNSAILTVFP